MSSSVQRWLRAKQGPACPGWILEPETPTLLLHLGSSLPDQVCLTWSALWCPPPTLQAPGVRLGMSAQAMQRWATAARLPPRHGTARHSTDLKRATVSYLWCDTLEGAPPCWGYLLFNLFAEGPSSKQSPSPGPRALRKSKVAIQSTGPILTLHLEEVPKPRICGRKNLYSG